MTKRGWFLLKSKLADQFKMKDLGRAKYLLGIQIEYGYDGSITINPKHYIEEVLWEFDYNKTTESTYTSAARYTSLTPREPTDMPTDDREYRRLVGKLNWLVRATRADIVTDEILHSNQPEKIGSRDWRYSMRVERW
jgi:hypothetical protein